jgi:hypothetical protein
MVLRYIKVGSLVQDSLDDIKLLTAYSYDLADVPFKFRGSYYQVPTGKKFIMTLMMLSSAGTGTVSTMIGYADDISGTNTVWCTNSISIKTPDNSMVPILVFIEIPTGKYPIARVQNFSVHVIGIEVSA